MEINNNILKSSRLTLLGSLLLFFPAVVKAQINYVLNPSLEQYWRCPTVYDEIKFAKYWSAISDTTYSSTDSAGIPGCVPDYCNTCVSLSTGSSVTTPVNGRFYHYPRTGNGLAQIVMFNDQSTSFPYIRDYLQGRLYKALTGGKNYCVTFYVCQERESNYSVNHIGAYLDNGGIDTVQNCGSPQTQYSSMLQALDTSIITDALNWTKIEGSFTANGTEKFITIGNFFDKTNTSYTVFNVNGISADQAIYILDDVSVIESDHIAFAGNDTSIYKGDSILLGEIAVPYTWYKDSAGLRLIDSTSGGIWVKPDTTATYVVKQTLCGVVSWDTVVVSVMPVSVNSVQRTVNNFSVYPNPAKDEITIQNTKPNVEPITMEIYDLTGKQLLEKQIRFSQNNTSIQLDLRSGVYMLKLTSNDGASFIQRLVIFK